MENNKYLSLVISMVIGITASVIVIIVLGYKNVIEYKTINEQQEQKIEQLEEERRELIQEINNLYGEIYSK